MVHVARRTTVLESSQGSRYAYAPMLWAMINLGVGLMVGALWLAVWLGWAALAMRWGAPVEAAVGRKARLCMTGGAAALLTHAVIAFDNFHNWSHEMARIAMELRLAEYVSTPTGALIYLTYAFLVLWVVEVLWSWISLASWQRRARWVEVLAQLFLQGYGVLLIACVGGVATHHVPPPPITMGAILIIAAGTWWGLRVRPRPGGGAGSGLAASGQ